MKPFTLARLKPGKAVGAVRNFAATFNWLVDFCSNLRGGVGVDVDRTLADRPIIKFTGAGADESWWDVKYDPTDGWLVHIPPNTVTLPNATVELADATEENDWYKVLGTVSGSGVQIWAHVKRRVKVGAEADAHPVITVHAGTTGTNADAGDIWSAYIATVDGTTHKIFRDFSKQVTWLGTEPDGVLQLYWALDQIGGTFTPHVAASAAAPITGGTLNDTALPASGSATVYYLVDCTGASPAGSVVTTLSTAPGKAFVQVYSLSNGIATEDKRDALNRLVYYP